MDLHPHRICHAIVAALHYPVRKMRGFVRSCPAWTVRPDLIRQNVSHHPAHIARVLSSVLGQALRVPDVVGRFEYPPFIFRLADAVVETGIVELTEPTVVASDQRHDTGVLPGECFEHVGSLGTGDRFVACSCQDQRVCGAFCSSP